MESEKTVTIRLPLTREEREDVFVGINGPSLRTGAPLPKGEARRLRRNP